MPRWVYLVLPVLFAAALAPLALIARSREVPSARTRIAIVQDMGKQPKFRAQSGNPMFADGRAMRLPVPGTVARGELNDDDRLVRGVEDGHWTKTIPVPVTVDLLKRGRERYGIYCAACHGLSGYGNGMVAERAKELAEQSPPQAVYAQPANFHGANPDLRQRDAGQLYDAIVNGVRNMPPYGSQIGVKDRWAIVAYIRALQRSQAAPLTDVREEKRNELR